MTSPCSKLRVELSELYLALAAMNFVLKRVHSLNKAG